MLQVLLGRHQLQCLFQGAEPHFTDRRPFCGTMHNDFALQGYDGGQELPLTFLGGFTPPI